MFQKQTIRDVPLDGQRVLMRADFNVPLLNGEIEDDFRVIQTLPTIQALRDRGCQIVICAHLGRPKGEVRPELSLEPVAAHLSRLLDHPVRFIPDCIGDRVRQAAKRLGMGDVLLLENMRFHPEEEANDPAFAHQLAIDSGAAYFVQDGFGVVHRKEATTEGVTHWLPSVAGLLLEKEVRTITAAMENPKRPLVAVLGGAKVSDKIKLVQRFVKIADHLIIGGAMGNTFLKYKGQAIGKSIHEEGQEEVLRDIYAAALGKDSQCSIDELLELPVDAAVVTQLEGLEHATRRTVDLSQIAEDEYIVDIGPRSIAAMLNCLQDAGTVIWNGTLGLAEYAPFAEGSTRLCQALAEANGRTHSIIGGGDTADFVLRWQAQHQSAHFDHISTGGGASLQLMAGETLPGVEALLG